MRAHLLVTGTTGFVGKVWLAMALEHFEGFTYTLVVRGGLPRLERIFDTSPCFRSLRARHGEDLGRWLAARIEVLDQNLTEPVKSLPRRPDCTLNFAGLTDFDPNPVKALAVNVDGALTAAKLSGDAPFLHISTCFVAGNLGKAVVEESVPQTAPNGMAVDAKTECDAMRDLCNAHPRRAMDRIRWAKLRAQSLGWPNLYTWSKAMGERRLREEKPGGVVIIRPAVVECAWHDPFPGWNEGVNTSAPLVWLMATAYRELPAPPATRFDVIPVDSVCRGIFSILAAALRGEADDVYQLGTSDSNPFTFGRCCELGGLAERKRSPDRWMSLLDPVATPRSELPVWRVDNLLSLTSTARNALSRVELPGRLGEWARKAHQATSQAQRQLRRIDAILEVFRPFIHDNDWEFRTDRVRALPPIKEELAFDAHLLDWRSYWVDIQHPGLFRWSIPLLHGEKIAQDPPSGLQIAPRELLRSAK